MWPSVAQCGCGRGLSSCPSIHTKPKRPSGTELSSESRNRDVLRFARLVLSYWVSSSWVATRKAQSGDSGRSSSSSSHAIGVATEANSMSGLTIWVKSVLDCDESVLPGGPGGLGRPHVCRLCTRFLFPGSSNGVTCDPVEFIPYSSTHLIA